MKIGIIGAGFIARAFTAVAMKHGHEIMVSNTRGPETLFSLTASTGCKAGSSQEAAEFGDIVLVAIPLKAYQTIPMAPLEGKIVLDANNYYPERDGHMAVELAPVRVNVVAPGIVRTPIWDRLPKEQREAFFEARGAALPVGKVGDPADVAEAYLSFIRSEYTTGQIVVVDGGMLLV